MSEYFVSQEAINDIENYAEYLLVNAGSNVASKFIDEIYQNFNLLANFPRIGRVVEDIPEGMLFFPNLHFKKYIFYRPLAKGVRIIRVLSHYQHYPGHFG